MLDFVDLPYLLDLQLHICVPGGSTAEVSSAFEIQSISEPQWFGPSSCKWCCACVLSYPCCPRLFLLQPFLEPCCVLGLAQALQSQPRRLQLMAFFCATEVLGFAHTYLGCVFVLLANHLLPGKTRADCAKQALSVHQHILAFRNLNTFWFFNETSVFCRADHQFNVRNFVILVIIV